MKRICLLLMSVSLCFAVAARQQGKLVILHTNDMHSKLRGFAPETAYSPLVTGNDNTVGGFARLATIIKEEKESAGDDILVLDDGDFLMGTLFHHFEAEDGFQLRLMKKMGYDAVSIGNHEFDAGPDHFAQIVEAAAANGEIPSMVLSNIVFSRKDEADNRLEALFTTGVISRELIIEKPSLGLKIGIFALMGIDAADVAPAAEPVTFAKQKKSARKMVRRLRKEGCNMVICLSHSGLMKDKKGNLAGEDHKLARKVKGIDLIISGHTHTKLEEPIIVKGVPIVQTGSYGENVGRVVFDVASGKATWESYMLIPVNDDVMGDAATESLIEERMSMVEEKLLKGLNLEYNGIVAETDFDLVCDEYGDLQGSNLGPLVADAIHTYINTHTGPGSDISIVAAGVIRQSINTGEQSVPDIFRVMSLGAGKDEIPGYPLSRVYVTGRELKNIVEILLNAWKSSPSNYIYYSGLDVRYDPGKGLLRKVVSVDIVKADGGRSQVDFSKDNPKLYSISANSYILEFIGIIKSMSFGLINVVPKDAEGNALTDFSEAIINFAGEPGGYAEGKEWLALIEFLSAMPDTNGNGIPDIDPSYMNPASNVVAITK
ncbi:MAG: bifunctional metallophosphatase/5'-nucleotidase [Bacteroidales bacterium]|nr:bifunctional metallophosphatase/5'-nucleotidase [Bacteroidales bacterium]